MGENKVDTILVVNPIVGGAETGRVERGLTRKLTEGTINAVSVSELKENMEYFFAQLRELFDTQADRIGAFEVSEITISAQITGDGKVGLLGSGVNVGVQGGFTFVLKRINK